MMAGLPIDGVAGELPNNPSEDVIAHVIFWRLKKKSIREQRIEGLSSIDIVHPIEKLAAIKGLSSFC